MNPRERGPESGAPPVYCEVTSFLKGFKLCELLAQHSVGVRLARQEKGKLGLQVRNDDVNDFVQVRQAVALVVLEPVVRVAPQGHAFSRNVASDGEGAGAYHLRRISIDVPGRCEGAVVHVLLQDMFRIYRRAHGAEERGEGQGENALDRVVVQRRDCHRRLLPLAGCLVQEAELEGRAAAGRDVVVVDDAVEGEVHVVGVEWLPVVPPDFPAQVERPRQAVLRALPGLRQRRLHRVGPPRGLGQAVKEVSQNTGRRGIVGNGEVEGKRFGNSRECQGAARLSDGVLEPLGIPFKLGDHCGSGGRCKPSRGQWLSGCPSSGCRLSRGRRPSRGWRLVCCRGPGSGGELNRGRRCKGWCSTSGRRGLSAGSGLSGWLWTQHRLSRRSL